MEADREDLASEAASAAAPAAPLGSLTLKWKTREWWLLMLFNCLVVLFMAIDRIVSNRFPMSEANKVAAVAVTMPLLFTLLILYMYRTLRHHRDHITIIKVGRMKYFRIGSGSSFLSFLFALVVLVASCVCGDGTRGVNIAMFVAIALCILLGIVSSVCSSMYGFCSSFDVFYHKNREDIIRAYLAGRGVKSGEKAGPDLKILGGEETNEG